MRGLRLRQKEITKISKADGQQRLREILDLAMPVSFEFKKDCPPTLQRTLGIILPA